MTVISRSDRGRRVPARPATTEARAGASLGHRGRVAGNRLLQLGSAHPADTGGRHLTVASVAAWVGWMKTAYAHPVQSRRVIAVYLCAVAFQLIHMAEEYRGGFPHEIVDLFDSPRDWSEKSFLLRLKAEAPGVAMARAM